MNFTEILNNLLSWLNELSVAFTLIFAIIALIQKPSSGKTKDLEFIISRALAGGAFPTGIALIGCAFKPIMISKLEGASINVAIAGIALLYISYKAIFISKS